MEQNERPTFQRIGRALALLVVAGFAAAIGEDLWSLVKDFVDSLF